MDYTILINKDNLLDLNYVPSDLIVTDNNENNFHQYIDSNQKPMISASIYPFFLKMQQAALNEGYHIIIDSGYRSSKYQQEVWDNMVKKRGLEYTKKSVAIPGSSEHQSGLAFDIAYFVDGKYCDGNHITIEQPETNWLFQNAHRFGFILRYPQGKEDITGFKFEPWHYRFVGIELATLLFNEKITLEEYYRKRELNELKNIR